MYLIGLIDDEESQLKAIRRTIKTNAKTREQYEFKAYLMPDNVENPVETMFADVMNDIKGQKLTSLIIDYKIMVKTLKVKGTDIFQKIKEEVPKFPVIILTEVVEESMEPAFIDADKVYKKKDFFKIEEEYSKEKVFNIFDSMKKYVEQRDRIELTIEDLKQKLVEGSVGRDVIGDILLLESQLGDFVPTDQTQIDRVFDEGKAKKIVNLIERANQLLE